MDIWEEEHSVSTGVKKEYLIRFTYKWTIHNFSSYNNTFEMRRGRNITSPLLRSSNSHHYLMVYPSGLNRPNFVTVKLKPEIDDDFATESNVDFSILHNEMQLANKTRATLINNKFFICDTFVSKVVLYDATKKLLNGHSLTVVCTFTKFESIDNISSNAENEIENCRVKASLSNDLQKLLQNRLLTDVKLVANDKELYAHKSILIARSPVFAAMLQNDMEEKMKSKIQINDYSADLISQILQFMYTEKVANIKDHFQDLLCLANKYDIDGLKLVCGDFMLSELTIENIIDVFLLSESQNCSVLRPKLIQFIIKNSLAIIQSPQFESRKKDLPSWCVDILKAVT